MPCHLCGNDPAPVRPWRANFQCQYCFADREALRYCRNCAWWEVGPLPAALDPDLQPNPAQVEGEEEDAEVAEQPVPQDIAVLPCGLPARRRFRGQLTRLQEAGANRRRILTNRRNNLLTEMSASCRLLEQQLEDEGFKTQVTAALKAFDEIYHRLGLQDTEDNPAKTEEKTRQRMMHALIVVYLSAQRRCAVLEDELIHRHDSPRFAAKHLEVCFFAGDYIPGAKQALAQAALSQEVVERYLKRKLSISVAHKQWVALNLDADERREALRIAIMIYHCCTVEKTPDDEVNVYNRFVPVRAHGYLSIRHKEDLYGEGASRFTEATIARLGALYAACDRDDPPAGHRFPDDEVEALVQADPGVLTREQADYLQSIPRMDRTGAAELAGASECELNVRRRVISRLNRIFGDNLYSPAHYAQTLGNDDYRPAPNAQVMDPGKRACVEAEYLDLRAEYRQVFARFINNVERSDLLDAIIQDVRSTKYWRESTATSTLLELYADAIENNRHADFALKSETELKMQNVPWNGVFPVCPRNNPGQVDGEFSGMRHSAAELAARVDGRQEAANWYLDWRVDKDRFMYDCSDFPPNQLPNFTTLALWRWPEPPMPNFTYGQHMIVWDPAIMNFNRSVVSLGDRGVPRRSVLLLLQDLLCDIPRKDETTWDDDARRRKFRDFERMILHLAHRGPDPVAEAAAPVVAPRDHWNAAMAALAQRLPLAEDANVIFFETDQIGNEDSPEHRRKMMARRRQLSNDDVENLEYHVFGKVKLDDALALFLFRRGTGPGPDDVPDESVLTGRYDAIAGGGALPWSLRKYHFENINASGLQSIRFPLNDSRAVGMWDLLVEILRAAPTPGELQ